jgi:hypothetical protein
MKQSYKFAAGVIASLGLGLAIATAYAQSGQMGGGMGHEMKGGMQHGATGGTQHGATGGTQHGAKGGMQHGTKGGMQHGGMGGAGHGAGQQLMTPEERTAVQEKMRSASTPEERQQIAAANRAEMQKRAQEKGVTLHEGRGPRHGTAPQAPATTEHQH